MLSYTINNTTLRAGSPEGLFRKIARELGGRDYVVRCRGFCNDGTRVYELTAFTSLPRQRCREVNGRCVVTV